MDKAIIQSEFKEKLPKYERLAKNLCEALEGFLNDEGISCLGVSYRIKSFESFWEKISRKGYNNPFSEINDICGIRVIVYFPSDVNIVDNLIARELDVIDSEDKSKILQQDQFNYRSDHYVVRVKREWLKAPNYRGLNNIRAEIQVRTVLMHSWADLSHKLAYKSASSTPQKFMRELYQLSALFELADEKFEDLRNKKNAHIEQVSARSEKEGFDLEQPLDVDVLQAYLGYRFKGRKVSDSENVANFIDEINQLEITLSDIDKIYLETEGFLDEMEDICLPLDSDFRFWAQLGMVRMILEHFDDRYAEFRSVSSEEHEKVLALVRKQKPNKLN